MRLDLPSRPGPLPVCVHGTGVYDHGAISVTGETQRPLLALLDSRDAGSPKRIASANGLRRRPHGHIETGRSSSTIGCSGLAQGAAASRR